MQPFFILFLTSVVQFQLSGHLIEVNAKLQSIELNLFGYLSSFRGSKSI